jgi:Fur family ferric uptake transcriptional regulator
MPARRAGRLPGTPVPKRRTSQQEAIQEVFRREDRPLAISEILKAGRRIVRSLNQATVYRNVKRLVEQRWLKTIHVPQLGTLYERAEKAHHHHFQCRSCDRLYELPGCTLRMGTAVPRGFVTEDHEVFLFGVCSACST